MNKTAKKFLLSGIVGVLTFIIFACNFVFVKMKWGGYWWTGVKTSGFKLIGEVNNFGGFLSDAFSILIIIGACLVVVLSVFGILNAIGKTKIKFWKLSVDVVLKWTMFITLCLTFLNIFWILIDVGSLNKNAATKTIFYVSSWAPTILFLFYGLMYVFYCLVDGKFLWMPKFWEKFAKKNKKVKNTEEDKIEEVETEIKEPENEEDANKVEIQNIEEPVDGKKKKFKKDKKAKE